MILTTQKINRLSVTKSAVARFIYVALAWVFSNQIALSQAPAPVTPGQGPNAALEISGDILPPPAVPTVNVFNSASSIFANQPEQIPLTIYLRADTYSHNTHQFMGKRTVLTIRPNTLNAMQLDLVKGILHSDLYFGQMNADHVLWLDINTNQLEQLQAVLYPSINNTKNQSSVATQLFHYLPVVKRFTRYAVMLGLVFATVLLAFASYSLVMGQRGSSEKIIGTVAGLIVLLLAFSIYSLLISEATKQSSSSATSLTNYTSPMQLISSQ